MSKNYRPTGFVSKIVSSFVSMSLDRWIALFLLIIFLVYGYTAWFGLDHLLPPVLRRNPVWPSSFPKLLSVIGLFMSLVVILNLESSKIKLSANDIDYRKLHQYRFVRALLLLFLMLGYAFLLRPIGFLLATFLFLFLGSLALGERRLILSIFVSLTAAFSIWYLVDRVLGIYLSPLPHFLSPYGFNVI